MNYWLVKSEPDCYSFEKLAKDGRSMWDGVRNFQARNNLMKMKVGDQAFFYHSNIGKEIVGICEVVREHYPDPTDESGKFVVVDVAHVKPLKNPVTLQLIKSVPKLQNIALLKQSRLSVMPITNEEWNEILSISGDSL